MPGSGVPGSSGPNGLGEPLRIQWEQQRSRGPIGQVGPGGLAPSGGNGYPGSPGGGSPGTGPSVPGVAGSQSPGFPGQGSAGSSRRSLEWKPGRRVGLRHTWGRRVGSRQPWQRNIGEPEPGHDDRPPAVQHRRIGQSTLRRRDAWRCRRRRPIDRRIGWGNRRWDRRSFARRRLWGERDAWFLSRPCVRIDRHAAIADVPHLWSERNSGRSRNRSRGRVFLPSSAAPGEECPARRSRSEQRAFLDRVRVKDQPGAAAGPKERGRRRPFGRTSALCPPRAARGQSQAAAPSAGAWGATGST